MTDLSSLRSEPECRPERWHIFCRVIDNYGDIGVCWRLAQQLAREHGRLLTLWVDDLHSFAAICPVLQPESRRQWISALGASINTPAIEICHWAEDFQWPQGVAPESGDVVDVVIEAFACHLPEAYLAQMQAAATAPLWINLEYLSAEDWVPGFHLSPSPVHGMLKYFFFPGFAKGTGGLLYEPFLPALVEHMSTPDARQQLLTSLGLASSLARHSLQISLFAYENPAIAGLLDVLSQYLTPVHVLVPQGRTSADVNAWLGEELQAGQTLARGSLAVSGLPFLSQPQYDQLLAMCDLNFVRGEESFVRAQMLGKPFIWHIYHQQENAHLDKLAAFMALYLAALKPLKPVSGGLVNLPALLAGRLDNCTRDWNTNGERACGCPDWDGLLGQLPLWQQHASQWQQHCLQLGDVAQNLINFRENTRGNRL
jgi:uncharacterized repeat protein (TIGR03837 family)